MMMSDAPGAVDAIYTRLMRCSSGQPFSASDACTADGGATLFFIGQVAGDRPSAPPQSTIYRAQRGADPQPLHDGPAKLLALAPGGDHIAFALATADGRDRLIVMTTAGQPKADLPSEGRIEQVAWSPDGQMLLTLVAGAGTDTTTLAGSLGANSAADDAWAPTIDDGAPDPEDWRRLAVHCLGNGTLDPGPHISGMVWEASWCGNDTIAILHSDTAGEAAWYEAVLATVDLATADRRTIFKPQRQLGHIQGCPAGGRIAFVEGVASDRGLICGALKLIDLADEQVETLDTGAVEITSVAWRADALQLAGQTGLKTVVGDFDLTARHFDTIWSSIEWSCGAYLPTARPAGAGGAIAVVESYAAAPRIAILSADSIEPIVLLADDDAADAPAGQATPVSWRSPDGSEIEGILVRPTGATGPLPLVVDIHGGPVWAYRARWQGRQRATPALVAAGISVLYPNPRGSFARGQEFAAAVLGDMGGADSHDILSGIDHLVAEGLVDPDRIGLTGSSYGGYMSAWLPKLRDRIAAAVCISPVTNWFSQHWTSNMPILEELFIGGTPRDNAAGYLERSPALSGVQTQAATLILAGELDRCTPIGQSIELHRSLLDSGATSVLVTYPQDGHGVRAPRAYIDSAARTLDWFRRYLTA